MDKRVLMLKADGIVYQRGKVLSLPPEVNMPDAGKVRVGDISLLIGDEQENFYQILCLPLPQTEFHARDKGFVVDVPERKCDLIIYDCKASDGRAWIRKQMEYDERKRQEDAAEAAEEEEEGSSESEQEPEPEPESAEAAPEEASAAQVVEPAPVQPLAPVQALPGLEVVAPVPLMFPVESKTE